MPSESSEEGVADDRFADAPISRRQFIRLSAVTGGAITLPGNAHGDHTSPETDGLYEFVRNHTRDAYEIPTLIRLTGRSGLESLPGAEITGYRETRAPEPAAYGQLDAEAISTVLELDSVTGLTYSPGSNPFWKLNAYPDGVFPDPTEAVDYAGFEETEAGLSHLAEKHPDRLRLTSIGESPGHRDLFSGDPDPKGIRVAELTNDLGNDAAFEAKEKLVYVLSIHGDERVGVEAGNRFIERVLAGEEPEVENVLDDAALVFLYANPDGWVVREPRYPGQRNGFRRETATEVDPNRQYPTAGRIDPAYHPADPDGRNLIDDSPGVDRDVPERVAEHTSDTLAIVHHLREYENVEFLADLHGMHWSEEFVLSMVPNGRFDHARHREMDRINRMIGEGIEDEIGSLEDNMEALSLAPDRYDPVREEGGELPSNEEMLPDSLYDFGTIYDTVGYSTTGGLLSWAAHPESTGGLGAKAIAVEMAFANSITPMEKEYLPELMDVQAGTFIGALRAMSRAVPDASGESLSGGRTTAVIAADGLVRSSDTLAFTGAESERTRTTVEVAGRASETVTFTVSLPTDEISVHVRSGGSEPGRTTLSGPDGAERRSGNETGGGSSPDAGWTITDPATGQWSVVVENPRSRDAEAVVSVDAVVSDTSGDSPDPRDVLGYEQRLYESTPLAYFEEYAESVEGRVEFVPPRELTNGVLVDGGDPVYDNVVAITDAIGRYDAIDDYVAAGGNLVVTDTGVRLLSELRAEPAAVIDSRAVSTDEYEFAALDGQKADGHPLLEETREIERELWTLAPRGYAVAEEAPVTTVVPEVFEAAGGTIAGTVDGGVAVGSLDENVHVIGSLLPPSSQNHLHPFGLLDHSVSMLGHTVLSNALGYEVGRE